jgi:hypothetical protein
MRAVLIELRRFLLHGACVGRAIPFAVEIDGEGVVAHAGQHVGAAFLVVGQAVPIVDDQHQSLGVAFCIRPVALERLAVDVVDDGFTGLRGNRR